MITAAGIAAALTVVGLAQAAAGAVLVGRFTNPSPASAGEGISVLKPLHGDEPLLEAALASACDQDFPAFQIVFGVTDRADPALAAVQRLRARFPRCDIAVVADPTRHGANGKVGNLINMLPAAKYNILVIADSDVHAQPDYLARLAETLAEPGTGLATTLYTGLPASEALPAQLGAMQITHNFLPGAVLARAMGRQDCLGATMALRRETLTRIGGLQALVNHLADDQVLGRRVAALGLAVRLAHTVVATTVPEASFPALWRHELRWARTIRALVPGPFAASILQYPLFWALLAIPLSLGAVWSWGIFLVAWVLRAVIAWSLDRALAPMLAAPDPRDRAFGKARYGRADPAQSPEGLAFACPLWLLPLRDLISVVVMLASYAGRRVEWRGQPMTADTPGPGMQPGSGPGSSELAAPKGLRPR